MEGTVKSFRPSSFHISMEEAPHASTCSKASEASDSSDEYRRQPSETAAANDLPQRASP
jgi:hypothetical protein